MPLTRFQKFLVLGMALLLATGGFLGGAKLRQWLRDPLEDFKADTFVLVSRSGFFSEMVRKDLDQQLQGLARAHDVQLTFVIATDEADLGRFTRRVGLSAPSEREVRVTLLVGHEARVEAGAKVGGIAQALDVKKPRQWRILHAVVTSQTEVAVRMLLEQLRDLLMATAS